MAITHVGSPQGTSGTMASTVISRTPGAIGNLLIAGYVQGAPRTNAATISDTGGNTWNIGNPDTNDVGNNARLQSWYAYANGTGSITISISSNNGSIFNGMSFDEFTGNHTSASFDAQAVSALGASGTPTTSSITLGANDCLIWAYATDSITAVGNIDGSAATAGGDDGSQDWAEYRILTGRSGATCNATFTGSGAYDAFIMSFKPATSAAGGASKPPFQSTGDLNGMGSNGPFFGGQLS